MHRRAPRRTVAPSGRDRGLAAAPSGQNHEPSGHGRAAAAPSGKNHEPSGHGLAAAPSGHGLAAAPSGHGLAAAPSGHGLAAAPSGHGRAAAPSAILAAALLGACAGAQTSAASSDEGRAAAGGERETETRRYYVAAEEVTWDYAPAGRDMMMGKEFDEGDRVFVETTDALIGSEYEKVRYVAYTDASFSERAETPERWEHKGLLGPIFSAEVGDTIEVVFKNNASLPYSIHPHGVFYDKANEGAMTNDGTSGDDKADDAVAPGESYTYRWDVPPSAGPGPADPSSVVWLYHSHVDTVVDTNSGLIGAMVVAEDGMLGDDGVPKDVDRQFISLFKIYDENQSWYLDDSIQAFAGEPSSVDPEDAEFAEGNLMHAINGYVYGSLPLLEMEQGDKVRWYLVGFGSEPDLHTPHWHGNTVLWEGRRADVVDLLPATMIQVDMRADNPGTWMYHCHVDDHIDAGMTGRYRVAPAATP